MNKVTALWDKNKSELISPEMPPKCCHWLAESTGTVTVEENGFKLEVPYCKKHLEKADKYYNEVYRSKKRKYVKYFAWAVAPVAAYIFIFLALPASDIVTGEDKLVKMFVEALGDTYTPDQNIDYQIIPMWIKILAWTLLSGAFFKVIPYILDKWMVLYTGAHELGFWENRYSVIVSPGITDLQSKDEGTGQISYTISFLRKDYAILMRKKMGIE